MEPRTSWGAPQRAGATIDHYRADIDGLRAIAVALVVVFHAFPNVLPGGFIGVDVFFVVSGFLITRQILSEQAGQRFTITSFYERRARRILPALVFIIATALMVGWFILLPVPYERLAEQAVAGAMFFPNILFWSQVGYFDTSAISKPLLHLWSLGVEEQFYLIWPLLLIVLRKSRVRPFIALTIICTASLVYSSTAAFTNPAAAFYSPLSRLWELGFGAVLAARPIKVPHQTIISALGLIVIVGSAWFLSSAAPFPGVLAVPPALGTAAIIVAPSPILRQQPFVGVGLISYTLYLWHWPILSFAATLHYDGGTPRALVVAASVVLAWLTTRYVERPIRFGLHKSRGAMISALALGSVTATAAVVILSAGPPIRYPVEIRPVLATMDYHFREQAQSRTLLVGAQRPVR